MSLSPAAAVAQDPDLALYAAQQCRCQYCGFDGSRSEQDWLQLQLDHLIPRHIASDDHLNLIVSCYYCNAIKRQFNPAAPGIHRILTPEQQQALLAVTRDEIARRKQALWAERQGVSASFALLRQQLADTETV